jgi:exonuclease III
MTESYFHLISLNVRGIRKKEKRQSIFQWLKNQHADITLLQETFLDDAIEKYIKYEWNGHMLNSFGSLHSRGVSILFRKGLDFDIESYHSTTDGRTILVNLKIGETKYTIVNIYAPTNVPQKDPFYRKAQKWIKKNAKYEIIIGGDFNCIQNQEYDTLNVKKRYKKCMQLDKMMKKFSLIDIWRKQHPRIKQYTWRQVSLKIASRLDYWLICDDLKNYVQSVDIRPAVKADHNAISLKIILTEQISGAGYWKFNSSLVHDLVYKEMIRKVIHDVKLDGINNNLSGQLTWELLRFVMLLLIIVNVKRKNKRKR